MPELTSTRMNPLLDPALHIWGWEIPVYLFLGGLVAGMMLISGYLIFSGRYRERTQCACYQVPTISLLLLTLGMLALFLDLEHKGFTWRLYTTFELTSPMSWGAWILLLVYPAIAVLLLLRAPDAWGAKWHGWLRPVLVWSSTLRENPSAVRAIGVLNMLLGGMLGMYTGVLLSAVGARPLWNSAILWLLFLVSGASSAAALVHMIAQDRDERELLAKADNGFLVLELFVIALYLIGLVSSTSAHQQAASLLLSGTYAPVFWVFVVMAGILLPLIVQILAVQHKVKHTAIPPLLVLFGGLVLRFVIVYAGQTSHWIPVTAAALR
ncbi:polysulfide reductase NrfD [candidate division KSB1 bacterium]|nr:polysulfide reductase NrfD [candidate division KSB1 bacterium]